MKANASHIELHIGSFHVGIDESEHDAFICSFCVNLGEMY
jgi:hypothetical protein